VKAINISYVACADFYINRAFTTKSFSLPIKKINILLLSIAAVRIGQWV
jgi:hypothetical protein